MTCRRVSAVGVAVLCAACLVCGGLAAPPAERAIDVTAEQVRTQGFTVRLAVDFTDVKGDEPLYKVGSVQLAFRLAGKTKGLEDYDVRAGNYLNFPLADGTCPVIEATICETAGRVGIPLGFLERTGGVHEVTLNFSPVHWTICVDGHQDDDMPVPRAPVVWPAATTERILSSRVKSAAFKAPADAATLPKMADARRIVRPIQYWTPDDHNAWVGDVALGCWKGRFHVFYLFDRRHHGSGAGAGRHFFAHLSSGNLKDWDEHPSAVPIETWWECIGTGTPFTMDGQYCLAYGLHTERFQPQAKGCPAGGTYAISRDGIHFRKSGVLITADRNPSVYNRADGRLGMGTANGQLFCADAGRWNWAPDGAKAPTGGDCPAPFVWGDREYLIQGFYWMASRPRGGAWEDWTLSGDDLYEGLGVPMVASWTGDRRIYVGWLNHVHGWGGWLVFRELVRFPDGKLGLKWLAETPPPVPPKTFAVTDVSRPFILRAASRTSDETVEFRIDPREGRAQYAFPKKGAAGARVLTAAEILAARPEKERFVRGNFKGDFAWKCGPAAIGHIRGLDKPFDVRIVQYYDPKSDATIFDAEIAGTRTFITRRAGAFAELTPAK